MGAVVGSFLKTVRKKRGVSQKVIAEAMGCKTAQSISNIERGVSPMPKSKIKKVALALRIPPTSIVDSVMCEIRQKYMKAAGIRGR